MTVAIAPAPWDAPEVAALRDAQQAELTALFGWDAEPGAKPTAADVTVLLLARAGDGTAVGCGALRALDDPPGAVELKRMYVVPGHRRRGVARALLAALEAEARRRGFVRARLETGDRMPVAAAFYAAHRYARIACFGAYAASPTSHCYERRLD